MIFTLETARLMQGFGRYRFRGLAEPEEFAVRLVRSEPEQVDGEETDDHDLPDKRVRP